MGSTSISSKVTVKPRPVRKARWPSKPWREASLGPPVQVLRVVPPLGPRRDPRDMLRVVLVPDDPDRLASLVLQALAEDLDEQASDMAARPGLAKNWVVTSVLIACSFLCAGSGRATAREPASPLPLPEGQAPHPR